MKLFPLVILLLMAGCASQETKPEPTPEPDYAAAEVYMKRANSHLLKAQMLQCAVDCGVGKEEANLENACVNSCVNGN